MVSGGCASQLFTDGINYINNIVTGLFKVGNEVHVVDTGLIFVVLVVDVLNVGCTELIGSLGV